MIKKILILFCIGIFAFANEPLSFAIQHPARLSFYALYPQSPRIEPGLHVEVSVMQTNEYEQEKIFLLDYGMTTLQLDLRYGLSEESQLRLVAPFHYIYGGFLDGALDWFHSSTDTLKGRAHNAFGRYKVHFHYGSIDRNDSFFTPGNIEIQYKRKLPLPFPSALILGVKLPTAPKSKGFGTAKADLALELVMQKSFTRSTLLCHLSIAKISKYRLANLATTRHWIYEALVSWHYERWIVEYRFLSSPYHSSYEEIDSISNILNVGYRISDHLIFFASENLKPFYNSPDITFGLQYRF